MAHTKSTRTHEARDVPRAFAQADRLPLRTPIVGDNIVYLTVLGEVLSPERAMAMLRDGLTVRYETWIDA